MMRMIIAVDRRCHHSHSHFTCETFKYWWHQRSCLWRLSTAQHPTMCLRYHLPISSPDTNIYESLIIICTIFLPPSQSLSHIKLMPHMKYKYVLAMCFVSLLRIDLWQCLNANWKISCCREFFSSFWRIAMEHSISCLLVYISLMMWYYVSHRHAQTHHINANECFWVWFGCQWRSKIIAFKYDEKKKNAWRAECRWNRQ